MMPIRHNSIERVKDYLLGTIDGEEADRLEDLYFADSAFFEKVRNIETQLIRDFLDGRLSAPDEERFRARYMVVPELQKRLEEIRREKESRVLPFGVRLRYVFAGLALIACAIAPWLFVRHNQGDLAAANKQPPASPAVFEIALAPGITKSGGGTQAEFAVPKAARILLLLEMPGDSPPAGCSVTIQAVGEAGATWTGPCLEKAEDRGRARVEFDAAVLRPNDYIARVTKGGEVLETYSFRILPGK